jgi:hypothetical protein
MVLANHIYNQWLRALTVKRALLTKVQGCNASVAEELAKLTLFPHACLCIARVHVCIFTSACLYAACVSVYVCVC